MWLIWEQKALSKAKSPQFIKPKAVLDFQS